MNTEYEKNNDTRLNRPLINQIGNKTAYEISLFKNTAVLHKLKWLIIRLIVPRDIFLFLHSTSCDAEPVKHTSPAYGPNNWLSTSSKLRVK